MSENTLDSINAALQGEMPPQQDIVHEIQFTDQMPSTPVNKKRRGPLKLWQKVLIGVFVVLLLLSLPAVALAAYTVSVVHELQTQGQQVSTAGSDTYNQFKAQNLPGVQQGIKNIQQKLKNVRTTYQKLAFYDAIPVAHSYYQDGIHGLNAADAGVDAAQKMTDALVPYADVLGFKGQGSFTGGTTEDRLKQILQTLTKITPTFDSMSGDLEKVKIELAAIDPKRYPESFRGTPIRSRIQKYQDVSNGITLALTQFRPAIEELPALAGGDRRKKYFILFQNDNELRPTGGFMTAYAIVNVDNGKVEPEKSDDIYQLDSKFKQKIPIPDILGKYLTTERYWNLRDMNTSPDFKTSMTQFLQYYQTLPDEQKNIDGVIAVDTRVLTDLLHTLGPINVTGAGTFSDQNEPKCNCPQIIYALSEIADRPTPYVRPDRKGILGPMMRELLGKAYGAPKAIWPQLFTVGWNNIQSRHIQMYFFDPQAQSAAELVSAAGRMTPDPSAQDFLAIVDANLGGAKSNLFVNSNVTQEVAAPSNGMINKKVTITYQNTRHGDNCNLESGLLCLNANMPDWNRLYIPKGSKLVKATGYKDGTVKQYDEGDFTVIQGEFNLEPQSQSKLAIEYTVPYTDTKIYRVKLWKQGGVVQVPTIMDVNGNQDKIILDKDQVYQTTF